MQINASLLFLPDADYRWRVCTTLAGSTDGVLEPTWSQPLRFSTAPSAMSWARASWIGGKQQLRSDFDIPEGRPVRARLHASGVGAFYVWLNGQRLGDHVLDPPQSVYPYGVLCE